MTIDEVEIKQSKFAEQLDKLRAYPARESKYIDLKEFVSINRKNLYDCFQKIVNGFKNGILLLFKIVGTKTDTGDQQPDTSDTYKQKKFNDFLCHIEEEQKNIDMNLFKEVFGYDTPGKMLQTLHGLKRIDSYNQAAFLIKGIVVDFVDRIKKMSEGVDKNKGKEVLKIVRFLNFV